MLPSFVCLDKGCTPNACADIGMNDTARALLAMREQIAKLDPNAPEEEFNFVRGRDRTSV